MESTPNSIDFQVTHNEQTYEEVIQTVQEKERPISEYIEAQPDLQKEADQTSISKDNTVRFREMQDNISSFALKYNLEEADVRKYAQSMQNGNLNGASYAFHNIRRKVRLDHASDSFVQFSKRFAPIKEKLYEQFGNVDELREDAVRAQMEERNVMEAARKRIEEEAIKERERLQEFQNMSDEHLDEEYFKAVENNNEPRMRDLVNEAARRKGYEDIYSNYQGVGAWAAPSDPGYESTEARRADVEENSPDVNIEDISKGYSPQPYDYFSNLRAYATNTPQGRESAQAINRAIDEIRATGNIPMVKVYRAVPAKVKEGSIRNADWVTPSRKYAEMHGNTRLEGKYRLIEQEVPANKLWWDGNDINEWGFDDGKGYRYKNAKNNRKLNDLITRDDKGNIIPPSKRFDSRKADLRFRSIENKGATNSNKTEGVNSGLMRWGDKEKASDILSTQWLDYMGTNVGEDALKQGEIIAAVENLSHRLNTPVHIIRNVEEIIDQNTEREKKKRGSKGWCDPESGEVYLVLPNAESVSDAQATVLHEAVAHKGLRGLLGDKFDNMMDTVYKNLPEDVKRKVAIDAVHHYNLDFRTATEEYLASIAEHGIENLSVWQKINFAIREFFRSLGINMVMKDEDIAYMLWKSKNRLEKDKKVRIDGLTSKAGKNYDVVLFKNPETGKIEREWAVRKAVLGVELSQDQRKKLQNGEYLWVDGLKKKDGTTFKAPIVWNAKEGKFNFAQVSQDKAKGQHPPLKEKKEITPANAHQIQVDRNMKGFRKEENKYSEKPVLSGKQTPADVDEQHKRKVNKLKM